MNVLAMKSYTCDKCDKQYSRKYDMLRHVRKAHPEDDEEEGNTVSHPPSKRRRLQEDDSRDSSDTESRSSLESEGSRDDESESEDEDETSGDETSDSEEDHGMKTAMNLTREMRRAPNWKITLLTENGTNLPCKRREI